jgi:hypothetical protein
MAVFRNMTPRHLIGKCKIWEEYIAYILTSISYFENEHFISLNVGGIFLQNYMTPYTRGE